MATQPIDIMASFAEQPPPIDYVVPGLIAGTVGAMISPGGTGKSFFALQLAAQIASGANLFGFGDTPSGQVVYLPAEDPVIAIQHRLYSLGAYLNPQLRMAVAERLLVHPLIVVCPNITSQEWYDGLRRLAEGRRLMILDTLRRFHVLDENNSGDMAQVIGKMESISVDTGCAIIFLHHTSKGAALQGAGDQQQASRGSSVLVDNVRWQSYLSGMSATEAEAWGIDVTQRGFYVEYGSSKINYGKPVERQWYKRAEGGILVPVGLERRKTRGARRDEA